MNRQTNRHAMKFLLLLLVFPMCFSTRAQTLQANYGVPAQPLQVGNGATTFKIRINGGTAACTGPSALNITLPPGYEYQSGSASVTGGSGTVTQSSASNNTAVLSVSNIPANPDSMIISYRASAGCGVIGGSNTTVTYGLNGCAGTVSATATVNAQNAQLNITSVTNNAFVGFTGQTYTRDITVTNNGNGIIDTIYLDSKNGLGLSITGTAASTGAITVTKTWTATDTTYRYRITAPTANGHLENNESIVFTETVKITGCSGAQTNFKAWYGPAGTECAAVSNTSTAGATVNTGTPVMAYTLVTAPNLKCKPVSNYAVLQFKNSGTGPMLFTANFIVGVLGDFTSGAKTANCAGASLYLDTTAAFPVQISSNGGTTWTNISYNVFSWVTTASAVNPGVPYNLNIAGSIPTLQAGDSIRIRFAIRAETPPASCCGTATQPIRQPVVSYTYTNSCGANALNGASVPEPSSISVSLASNTTPDATVNTPYTLTFKTNIFKHGVTSNWIDNTGFIEYAINMPAALEPYTSPDSNKLAGVSPSNVNWNTSTRVLTLRYPQSAFGIDVFNFYTLKIATMVEPLNCGMAIATGNVSGKPASCDAQATIFACGVEADVLVHGCGVCLQGGSLNYNPSITRTNYGIYSGTNNGIPGGTLNTANLRLDRMLFGDTIAITSRAKIQAGTAGNSFSQLFSEVSVNPADSFISAQAFIYNAAGTFSNTITAMPVVISGSKKYTVNAKTGTGAPASFNAGDSAVFLLKFKNSLNTAAFGYYKTNTYAANVTAPADTQRYGCEGNYTAAMENIQISAFNGTNSSGVSVTGCGTSTPTGYWQMQSTGPVDGSYSSRSAHFPYEIRPFVELRLSRVVVHPSVEVTNYFVRLLGQGATGGGYNYFPPLDSVVNDGTNDIYYYNISQLTDLAIGTGIPTSEGFYLNFYPSTRPKCGTGNYVYGAGAATTFRNLVLNNPNWIWGGMGFNTFSDNGSLLPLSASSPSPNQTVNSNTVSWEIQMSNPTIAAKPNAWLAEAVGTNGTTITSVQALSGPGGTVTATLAAVNGIYRLDSIPATSSRYFKVNATFTNCVQDSTRLAYDFNCNAYPADITAAQSGCRVKYLSLTVTAQTAALQLTKITEPSGTVTLCDNMPYELEVTNSGLGTATGLSVRVQLPFTGGIQYVPGTFGIKYPVSAGSYAALADANITISTGSIVFNIPAATLATLPGTEKFRIQFQMKTLPCDFTSGEKLVFRPAGKNACNANILGTSVAGNRINLAGAPLSLPQFTISSKADSVTACGNGAVTTNYKFKLVNTGGAGTSVADGFRITLPAPWTLNTAVTYSHNPSLAVYATSPAANIYDFKTGTGLVVGDSIVFTATLSAASAAALACGASNPIMEAGFVEFSSFCASPATTCNTKQLLEPENAVTSIFVRRPAYSITAFNGTASGNPPTHLTGTFTVVNANSTFTPQSGTLKVYKDANSNGIQDAGDVLVGTQVYTIANSASQVFSYNITATSSIGNICPVVAVLELACNCDTPSFSYNCSSIVLRVKFSAAEARAEGCTVSLTWQYEASETIVTGFIVERSKATDNKWEQLAQLPQRALSYTDIAPAKGQWLYRIQALNTDNEPVYSRMLQVNTDCADAAVQLFPNPATNQMNIVLNGATASGVHYVITDKLGRTVQQGSLKGNTRNTITVSALASGMYHLHLVYDNKTFVEKMEIAR